MVINIPTAYQGKAIQVKVPGSSTPVSDSRWQSWVMSGESLVLLDASDFRVTQFAAGTWTQVGWAA